MLNRTTPSSSVEALVEADIECHRMIAMSSGNSMPSLLIENPFEPAQRARVWRGVTQEGALGRTLTEHQGIFDALKGRDPESGTELVERPHRQCRGMDPAARSGDRTRRHQASDLSRLWRPTTVRRLHSDMCSSRDRNCGFTNQREWAINRVKHRMTRGCDVTMPHLWPEPWVRHTWACPVEFSKILSHSPEASKHHMFVLELRWTFGLRQPGRRH